MTNERADLMLDILKRIQLDLDLIRRDQNPQGARLLTMEDHQLLTKEDHQRGFLTSLQGVGTSTHGVEIDISHLKNRVDRIERRLGLMDTEH